MLFAGSIPDLIPLLTALVVGLTVHEYAHARTAFALGDLTAYASGRMTLNPLSHIEPMGALMFLVAGFGWAKPVPIDPYRLGRQGTLLVALAGPVSNVLLALAALLPLRLGILPVRGAGGGISLLAAALGLFAFLNILLAVFNMLPVAPLDGWRVLIGIVPEQVAYRLQEYERYGGLILIGLIMLSFIGGLSILGRIIYPLAIGLLGLLAGPELAATLGW